MSDKVKMPRINIIPDVEQGVVNVELEKTSQINEGNPSVFPLREDKFKGLNFQSASQSEVKEEIAEYYMILNKIMAGESNSDDLKRLTKLTSKVREYILTDEDYNLVVGALQNMQTYILNFMYNDISSKAKAMDAQLNKVIGEINRFMVDLEETYSKSPSDYPIPNNSVKQDKLEKSVEEEIEYSKNTVGLIVSDVKPATLNKGCFWINTGEKVV